MKWNREKGEIVCRDCGLVIDHAPPALSFYQMGSSYFYLSDAKVRHRVDANGLLREIENIIPQRDENYSALGFDRFPIEGWGKHQAWMTPESFSKMLQVGLVEPERVFKILQGISNDKTNPSCESAKSAVQRLNVALDAAALSNAEIPVVVPCEASTETVKAVQNLSEFSWTISFRSSSSSLLLFIALPYPKGSCSVVRRARALLTT